jgi:hypothetical protein
VFPDYLDCGSVLLADHLFGCDRTEPTDLQTAKKGKANCAIRTDNMPCFFRCDDVPSIANPQFLSDLDGAIRLLMYLWSVPTLDCPMRGAEPSAA